MRALLAATVLLCATASSGTVGHIVLNGKSFKAEVVSDDASRSRGLMFRPRLDESAAMLFVYPREGVYSFWMKNMLFPLDLIWLGRQHRVVYVKENFAPCQDDPCEIATPPVKAQYIIEVKAGTVRKLALKTGTPVDFMP